MWTGTIANGMHEKIEAEFDKAKDQTKRVDLYLNSCGGRIREMEATIASLRHIKKTHRLETDGMGPRMRFCVRTNFPTRSEPIWSADKQLAFP